MGARKIEQGGKRKQISKVRAKEKDKSKLPKTTKSIASISKPKQKPTPKSKRGASSKPKQAEKFAQSDLPNNPAKAAQPLQNRILSLHWTQNVLGRGNCKYVYIKSGRSILQNLSISALVNFNFTAVQPNLHCFPKCCDDDLVLSKAEFEKLKSFFLICDSVTSVETNGSDKSELMHDSGYHFLSNSILPDKMKPDKLERMSKNLLP